MTRLKFFLIAGFILIAIITRAQDTLRLKLFTQGFYVGSLVMQPVLYNEGACTGTVCLTRTDTITVLLHNTTSPYGIVVATKAILLTDGTASASFSAAVSGNSYYIAVKHRSTLETWSASPVLFSAITNYDFSTAANQAYGSNMVQVDFSPVTWGFYSGDIDQDGNIDLFDFIPLDFGIEHGLFGYYASDLNGDGNDDLLDFPIFNSNLGKYVHRP